MWHAGPDPPRHRRHRAGVGHRPRHGRAGDQGPGARGGARAPSASAPWPGWWPAWACPSSSSAARVTAAGRDHVLDEVRDVMEGGGAGMAMGRTIYQDPDPAEVAGLVARAGARPVILTIDFGTSVTKVGLWGDDGLVALARSELTTTYPQVGWTEQDPLRWWTTLVIACAEARAQAPRGLRRGRRGGLLGRPPDLRPRHARRATRSARASCGRTTGPPPRRGCWPSAWAATTSTGPAPGSRSTPAPWRPSWPGWPTHQPERMEAAARDPVAARLHRLPHDRPDGDRRHLRLAQRPLRLRRQRRARAGRARPWASSRASCRPTPWSGSSSRCPAPSSGCGRESRWSSAPATASARSWARARRSTTRW